MSILGFRPRFKFESPMSAADIIRRIRQRVETDNPSGLGQKNVHYHITLHFPHDQAHTWTPQLDLNLEEETEGTPSCAASSVPLPTYGCFSPQDT